MLDNIEIAILTRLNALAERHGLKPYDYVAAVRMSAEDGEPPCALRFEVHAQGNTLREERYEQMLPGLGIPKQDAAVLAGDAPHVIAPLDAPLARPPKPHRRY